MSAAGGSPARRPTVGIGTMGAPMAALLVGAGYDVRVHDRDPLLVRDFVDRHGGTAAARVEEVVTGGGVVVTMLPDGDIVRSVVEGLLADGRGPLAELGPSGTVVDMSSSDPSGTVALGARLGAHGIDLLDAPVSGGLARARTGDLSIFVGGDEAARERCGALFAVLGREVWPVGGLGAGHALKALNNLMSATGLLIAAEVLIVGRRFGLEPATMLAAINASTDRNNSTENKIAEFVLSRSFDAGFALELMLKDLRTAVRLADDTGTPTPLATMVTELWAGHTTRSVKGSTTRRWSGGSRTSRRPRSCLTHRPSDRQLYRSRAVASIRVAATSPPARVSAPARGRPAGRAPPRNRLPPAPHRGSGSRAPAPRR